MAGSGTRAAVDPSYWAGYAAPGATYDEHFDGSGRVRPHFAHVADAWARLGAGERTARVRALQRALRENGVTYNVYDDPDGERTWRLDPLPLCMESHDWNAIESGLIQRAELLDLILADLYGERRLIARRLLPPELVFGHDRFLRAAVGLQPVAGRWLQLYAADIARGPQGQVAVLGDRAQAPSGAGYALESRIVLSRTLPSLYRDAEVHRLAVFFRALRARLAALAGSADEAPNIVLMTPGPHNETWFEQSYLAAYLGIPLVQGTDLTVRQGCVYMKTLAGLRRVHVILRRLDDDYCDPLELREDSLLGTPGLLGAARAGRVALANPIGSGVLENPGLIPFLPRLCRELLGADLRLPAIETWWCGDPGHCRHVLAHLGRLMVKPIARSSATPTVFGGDLSQDERERLAERIRARPWAWVGQERHALSTVPTLAGDRPEPRATVLRSFLVAQGQSYLALPGGLARVAPSVFAWNVTNQRGGIAKDVWVLASEPAREISLLPVSGTAHTNSAGLDLPSRVADDLFWLGRYGERAEATARVLLAVLRQSFDPDPSATRHDAAVTCVAALASLTLRAADLLGPTVTESARTAVVSALAGGIEESGGLVPALVGCERAARGLRDRLAEDLRRSLMRLSRCSRALALRLTDGPAAFVPELERTLVRLGAVAGAAAETLPRGATYALFDLGRRIERGVGTLAWLRAGSRSVAGTGWDALLTLAQCRSPEGHAAIRGATRGEFIASLARDRGNPRSLAFQLERIREHLAGLPGASRGGVLETEARLALEADTLVALADIDALSGPAGQAALEALLARTEGLLAGLSDALTDRYFGHVGVAPGLLARAV